MFTGLIETIGTLEKITNNADYRILSIGTSINADELKIGDSVACDGACLTIVEKRKNLFKVQASHESILKTIIGKYKVGSKINLERSMKADGRFDGHFVTGHVDTTGIVEYIKPVGKSFELTVKFDNNFNSLIVNKGSIAINGISLTINKTSDGWLSVNLIPLTMEKTNIGRLKSHDFLNLEFDLIGKYISKNINSFNESKLTKEKIIKSGW